MDNTVVAKPDYLDVVGLRAAYAVPLVKGLNVAGEYDRNMGKQVGVATEYKHQGYAYRANADYSMDLAGKLGIAGEYVFESGDDKTDTKDQAFRDISCNYRPGIILGGSTFGIVGTTGFVIYDADVNWTPGKLDKLNVAVTWYDLSTDKLAMLPKKHYGDESDLVATWTQSKLVSVLLRAVPA